MSRNATNDLMMALVAKHELHVRGQPGGGPLIAKYTNWAGCMFQNRCLDKADFSGANLSRSHFVATSFRFANFYCADLSFADLRGADFYRADLRGSILRGADFYGAVLDEADFRDASHITVDSGQSSAKTTGLPEVTGAATPADNRKVDFRDSSLKKANLSNAQLQGADFSGSNLKGANLTGADLKGAKFADAVLVDVDLSRVHIDKSELNAALLPPSESVKNRARSLENMLEDAETWSATAGENGELLEVKDEDFRPIGMTFQSRQIAMSKFENCVLFECDFSNALLVCSTFTNCDLRECNFDNADLRGVQFINCRMNFAKMRTARFGRVKVEMGKTIETGLQDCITVGILLPASAKNIEPVAGAASAAG